MTASQDESPDRPLVEVAFDQYWITEFRAAPGGVLRLGPGPVTFAFRFEEPLIDSEGWTALLSCRVRVADAQGRIWQAQTFLESQHLLAPLIDVTRPTPPCWLAQAPEEWRQALEQRLVLRDAQATYDDRFCRYFWVGNVSICLRFKYLGARFQVAHLGGDKFVVAVHDLFGCWNPLPLEGPDGAPLPVPTGPRAPQSEDEEEGWGDHDSLEPLAYELPCADLLFRHFALLSSEDSPYPYDPSDLPLPLVFELTPASGAAQPSVTHQRLPTPQQRLGEPGDAFHPVSLSVPPQACLQTDASGTLAWNGEALDFAYRLERHPGSATEPSDVLCCRLRLTDESGEVWEAHSLFLPDVLLEALVDLDQITRTDFFDDAEDEWRQALADCQLSCVRARLADGGWRYFLVGAWAVACSFHHQKPRLDIATGKEILVRVSGLTGRRRPIGFEDDFTVLDPEARASEVAHWHHDELLPPMLFQVQLDRLLFRNTTFAVDDGFWHRNPIPLPLVFSKVGIRATPQPGVRFVADPA